MFRSHCADVFMALSKAFGTVLHLHVMLIHYVIFGLLQMNSVYESWKYTIECLPVMKGVPQGSCLGPVLFHIYTYDTVSSLTACNAHFYADYTILYCFADSLCLAVNGLQVSLTAQNALRHASKTKMLFPKTRHMNFNS